VDTLCFCVHRDTNAENRNFLYLLTYICIYLLSIVHMETRGGAVGWSPALETIKIAGSIPDGVIVIFHWHPTGRTMTLRSIQPLTFPGGNGRRCVGLTILLPSCADCLAIWQSQPPRTLMACTWIALPIFHVFLNRITALNAFVVFWVHVAQICKKLSRIFCSPQNVRDFVHW
jgi:hypothetical protein